MRDEWASFVQPADQMRADWEPPPRDPGPLTADDVLQIRIALAAPCYAAPADLAAHFGISASMVSQIKHRRVWAHLKPPKVTPAWTHERPVAAEARLASFDTRRGQKARTRAALSAWDQLSHNPKRKHQ